MELYYLPARIYEHCYERSKGFSEASNCQFACSQLIMYFQRLSLELPIILLASYLLTLTKLWFFAALFGGTIVVSLGLTYIFPKLCMRCEQV